MDIMDSAGRLGRHLPTSLASSSILLVVVHSISCRHKRCGLPCLSRLWLERQRNPQLREPSSSVHPLRAQRNNRPSMTSQSDNGEMPRPRFGRSARLLAGFVTCLSRELDATSVMDRAASFCGNGSCRLYHLRKMSGRRVSMCWGAEATMPMGEQTGGGEGPRGRHTGGAKDVIYCTCRHFTELGHEASVGP